MQLKSVMYREHHYFFQKLFERRMKCLTEIISQLTSRPRLVLDIGCGDGTLLTVIPAEQKVGVDLDTMYVNLLKAAKVMFVKADARHLPFKSSVFDLVTALELLEHLEDPYKCIDDSMKILKNEGYFLVSVPNDYLWILGKLVLLRFKSVQRTLRDHKHHYLAGHLRSYIGSPIIDHSIFLFNSILLWKKQT